MANERGRLENSGGSVKVYFNQSNCKIIEEEGNIQLVIAKLPLPFGSSAVAPREITGRLRLITIQGVKWGTQTEIEAFLKIIDDWCNSTGLVSTWNYYPMIHKNNSVGTGSQNGYFGVVPENFVYRLSLKEVGYVLQFTLTLLEGIGVRNFTG